MDHVFRKGVGMTFLVVTESAETSQLFCYMLLSLGVHGLPVESVERARRELEARADVGGAVIDIDDATPGGRELVSELKRGPSAGNMILIALAGESQKETVAALAQAGVAGFLLKTAGRAEAFASLKNILERAAGPVSNQRRHIRVVPPAGDLLRLHFRVSGVPGLVSGRIINLSMGGLGVEIVSPLPGGALKPETFIERLRFTLRGRELGPSGVVVGVKGKTAGVRFVSLNPEDSIALAGYIFDKITV
jgi:DNA-binding response OmpR family regulator